MSKNQKYEYLTDTKAVLVDGKYILALRISALRDIFNAEGKLVARGGQLGGFITPGALAEYGGCWVDKNSVLISREGHTLIYGDAVVRSSQIVDAYAGEDASIKSSTISGSKKCYVEISGNSKVENTTIDNVNTVISGNVKLKNCLIHSAEGDGKTAVVYIKNNTNLSNSEIVPPVGKKIEIDLKKTKKNVRITTEMTDITKAR